MTSITSSQRRHEPPPPNQSADSLGDEPHPYTHKRSVRKNDYADYRIFVSVSGEIGPLEYFLSVELLWLNIPQQDSKHKAHLSTFPHRQHYGMYKCCLSSSVHRKHSFTGQPTTATFLVLLFMGVFPGLYIILKSFLPKWKPFSLQLGGSCFPAFRGPGGPKRSVQR